MSTAFIKASQSRSSPPSYLEVNPAGEGSYADRLCVGSDAAEIAVLHAVLPIVDRSERRFEDARMQVRQCDSV